MPTGKNQKLKLSLMARIMMEKTDKEHSLTLQQIEAELLLYGVTASRKSLYDDLEALKTLGLDVVGKKEGSSYAYHIEKKEFDIAELKLLVDAIQSSKFISENKSRELIKKVAGLASEHEARQLKRQVIVQGRIKTMNESVYQIVDEIHRAIGANNQIKFGYMQWSLEKKLVPHRKDDYIVSPWALIWDNENYYLVAYDEKEKFIKHFRVDKIKEIRILDKARNGKQSFKDSDLAEYTKLNFSMHGGERVRVKLGFKDEMVGVIIDRFGKDILIHQSKEKGWSETNVDVAMSEQFFGWVFGLGAKVKIMGPEKAVKAFKEELKEINEVY